MTNTPSSTPARREPRARGQADEQAARIAPAWLTRTQAATVAGVTPRTIDRWRADRTLTTYRAADGTAHRPVLVSRDDLLAALRPGVEA
jgi:hypothetical protein